MKNMKNTTPLFAMLLCTLLLGACAQDTTDTAVSDTASAPESAVEDSYESDNLPANLDLGNETITLGYHFSFEKQIDPETESGEVLDDEIYRRNRRVEERLNVTLEGVAVNSGDYVSYVRNAVSAADGVIDAFDVWQTDFVKLTIDNYFMELSDAPYLDYSKPWWAIDYMHDQTVDNNSVYFLIGDVNYGMLYNMSTCFYNKQLYAAYFDDANGLYDIVLSGKWTMDKLSELVKSYYSDLNGNGKVDGEDILGFGAVHGNAAPPVFFFYNMGCTFSTRDSDGYPVLDPATERNILAIDKMIDLFHNTQGCYFFGDDTSEVNAVYNQHFIDGKSGFFFAKLAYLSKFRSMEDDFGIIPFPKFDESQETYLSLVSGDANMFAIPSYAADPDSTCAVMEALASDSYRTVMPLFYETILKEKYSRDSTSSQVIDIIHENPISDFTFTMGMGYDSEIRQIVQTTGENTFTSFCEKNRKRIEKQLQSFIDAAAAT